MALNKNAPNAGKTGLDNVSMNLGRGNSNIDLEHINTENKTYF
jgi:hypothetical protein